MQIRMNIRIPQYLQCLQNKDNIFHALHIMKVFKVNIPQNL